MRTFAVGDIHGHVRMLDALLDRLLARAAPGDTLLFIGDYVDRGPDSCGVIEQVLAAAGGGWNGRVVTLMGNHEDLMLDHFREPDARLYAPGTWEMNGGLDAVRSYRRRQQALEGFPPQGLMDRDRGDLNRLWSAMVPETHLRFLQSLPLHYEDEHAYYVHAGLRPGKSLETSYRSDLLWIREEFIESAHAWDKPVVFGHTPQAENDWQRLPLDQIRWAPLNRPEKIGIDTGAAYGGPLTAVILPDREFISVPPGD